MNELLDDSTWAAIAEWQLREKLRRKAPAFEARVELPIEHYELNTEPPNEAA